MIRSTGIDKNVVLLYGDWHEGPQIITTNEDKTICYAYVNGPSFIMDGEYGPTYHLYKFANARVKHYSDDCESIGTVCDIQNIRCITAEECFAIWGSDQSAYNKIPNSLLMASPEFIRKMIYDSDVLPLTSGTYTYDQLAQIYQAAEMAQPTSLVALAAKSNDYIQYTHKRTPTFCVSR